MRFLSIKLQGIVVTVLTSTNFIFSSGFYYIGNA